MATNVPRLLMKDAAENAREVEIARLPFTLGRQGDNDLVLLDSRISRRHARIIEDNEGFLIEDAGSRHGTYVNGARVEKHRLLSGDRISLGVADGYAISFVMKDPELPGLLEKLEKARESPAPQLQHLGLLLQMAQMLNRAPGLEEVLTTLVDSAVEITGAERGLLFLAADGEGLKLRLGRSKEKAYLGLDLADYSKNVVERVGKSGREELMLEEEISGRVAQETAVTQGGVRGVVALPLMKLPLAELAGETLRSARPELLGVLYLDNRSRPTSLTNLDRQVLQTLAVEGATVIENARLLRLARDQERIQRELNLARNIQQRLLPSVLPVGDFFELCAVTVPCHTVGGDYYDALRLSEDWVGLTVADVSGKGVPAAMLAANLQGAFGAVAAADFNLESVFQRVNNFLCDRTPTEMYATMFYGVLDRQGHLQYVNAGHTAPLLLRSDGTVRALESHNFPVGFFSKAAFDVGEIQLVPGDLMLVYSDGVTEARNAEGEFFGEERLKGLLDRCPGCEAGHLLNTVADEVKQFVGDAPASDDITMVVLRYCPAA